MTHQTMTQANQANPTIECLYATICGFLLPFFLIGAGGNIEAARTAVLELIDAYNPGTPTELDLVGRMLGFSTAAMDNLRLSMTEGLSDTKILRYRSNAVSLSRAAEQARQILQTIQDKRETTRKIPRPAVALAPNPPAPERPRAATLALTSAAPTSTNAAPAAIAIAANRPPAIPATLAAAVPANVPPMDIEAMKREARVMMAAFSKHGAVASTAIAAIPDPAAFLKAAPIVAP